MRQFILSLICTSAIVNSTYAQGNASTVAESVDFTHGLVTQPVDGVTMPKDYAKAEGRMAYLWGQWLICLIEMLPSPSLINRVLPAVPQGQIAMLTNYIKP